jgi:hypothetical protein
MVLVAFFLVLLIVRIGMVLLGLTPEQRAAALAKRIARAAEDKAREDERASRKQQLEWFEAVAQQRARGHAGFANEAEAHAALAGKGGRPSNLDGRKFR